MKRLRSGKPVLVAMYAALVTGILPLAPTTGIRDLRLALIGCTAGCALLWALVSVRAPRKDAVVPGKSERREHPRPWILAAALGFAMPLASAAALVQAVGPDSEQGRWISDVYAAGGGTYEVPLDRVLGSPHMTGNETDHDYQFAADVTVTLRFDSGSRSVTVHDATAMGDLVKGTPISVAYAPSRPGLGVRNIDSAFSRFHFDMVWIWALALPSAIFSTVLSVVLLPTRSGNRMDPLRAFKPDVHGPAGLILSVGVCLLLPGAFFHTSPWAYWPLALAAATTPWLALAWALRRTRDPGVTQ
jgi:hypothetical protein